MKPLIQDGTPTWRDVILKVLRETELDTVGWAEESREMLADEIMAALRKSARSKPLVDR